MKRNKDAFEFIFFLLSAGIISALVVAASGVLLPFGLGFVAAAALILGIFLAPIVWGVILYVDYCERKRDEEFQRELAEDNEPHFINLPDLPAPSRKRISPIFSREKVKNKNTLAGGETPESSLAPYLEQAFKKEMPK